MTTAHLVGARVVAEGEVLDPGYVTVEEQRIVDVGDGDPAGVSREGRVDLEGRWLLPGYIDLHVHGGGGGSFIDPGRSGHLEATRFHARHGTTSLLATTVASSRGHLAAAVADLRETMRRRDGGARILGINLEGPYISHECRGAQDPEAIRDPDLDEFANLLRRGDGAIRVLTMAPELPGANALIETATEAGVVVSIGHAAATYDESLAAVAAGARLVTHMFNGMHPLHHREPGVVGAGLVSTALSCEVIADGMHVHPAVVRMVVATKGVRSVVLVTDAISAAGLPDGRYPLHEGGSIVVSAGRATAEGTDTLAGSTLTMEQAVKNVVSFAGVTVPEASRMASTNAAHLLGRSDVGSIRAGSLADLVVLSPELDVCATMVDGEWAYREGKAPPAASALPSS